jgi:hypothetical protein
MIRAALIAFATSLALALAARFIVRWRFGGKGRTINRLRPSGPFEYTAFALVVLTTITATTAQRIDEDWSVWVWVLALLLGLVAAATSAIVFFIHVFWTVEGIGSWDPWRKQRFIRWEHVRKVGWSPWQQAWFVSDGSTVITYSKLRNGVEELNTFIERRMNPAPITR